MHRRKGAVEADRAQLHSQELIPFGAQLRLRYGLVVESFKGNAMRSHFSVRDPNSHAGAFRSIPRYLAAGLGVLALSGSLPALADCVDTRKPTAGETEFHERALAALVAALPPTPVGATLQRKDNLPTLGQQCPGTTGDFTLEANRYYELNSRKSIVTMAMNVTRLPVTAHGPFAAYGAASPRRSAGLKVTNVVWKVEGSDSPLRAMLAGAIDRARLEAMVGAPLPTVAESRARAAQAVPASVAQSSGAAPAAPASGAPASQSTGQAPAANPSAPASAGQAGTSDQVKDTVDTVNKLRGLFGR